MHTHETWVDGKRFLDEIRSCSCEKMIDGEYELYARIHQRGKNWYMCGKDAAHISRDDGNRKWYLTPEAKKVAKNAIRRFETAVKVTEEKAAINVTLTEEITVCVRRR